MDQVTFKNTVFILKDEMYRFAKRYLLSSDEAEDVVQDLLIKLWHSRSDLQKYQNLKTFALKCIKNECLNRLKHQLVVEKHGEMGRNQSELYHIETNNLHEHIIKMIGSLPEKQKMVIHLKDVEEYEVGEIAEILDMAENAVRVNLMRARTKIREQLTQLAEYENRAIQNASV